MIRSSVSVSGEVMKNGDIRQIMNEGMPTYRSPYDKGRLIIQFSVKFPEKIDPTNVGKLEALLPPRQVSICMLQSGPHTRTSSRLLIAPPVLTLFPPAGRRSSKFRARPKSACSWTLIRAKCPERAAAAAVLTTATSTTMTTTNGTDTGLRESNARRNSPRNSPRTIIEKKKKKTM